MSSEWQENGWYVVDGMSSGMVHESEDGKFFGMKRVGTQWKKVQHGKAFPTRKQAQRAVEEAINGR